MTEVKETLKIKEADGLLLHWVQTRTMRDKTVETANSIRVGDIVIVCREDVTSWSLNGYTGFINET